MDKDNKRLISTIVEGMQETKSKCVTIVDMTQLDAPCQYFVIGQGNSGTQVTAIADKVKDSVRTQLQLRPFATDGYDNSLWIAMDYGPVIVHIFQPEIRAFYDIEHLWEDARIETIPDIQ